MTLKEYLHLNGIKQNKFVEVLSVSHGTISRWVKGHIPPPDKIILIEKITNGAVKPEDWYEEYRACVDVSSVVELETIGNTP